MSSDSENEERIFSGFYGKALEPYDEDNIPKKRAIPIEDQVAKDAQGRRRFHGAFTGGFSAGFFNTVGSLEGWRPSEFKSSRSNKAENKQQQPQDYMDDEDMGEFGIAPQTVKATDEYNTSRKRKKQIMSDGPIPGEPVLQTLIDSGNETIGYLLLRYMGYKQADDDEEAEDEGADPGADEGSKRVYSCEMPKSFNVKKSFNNTTCNIPEIYKNALANPKINSFGMGYRGLDRSHINLFTSSKLVVNERNNKKLSISGQAFGVGAFEDDDEDIYVKEDLTKYDFELSGEKAKEKPRDNRKLILDMFVEAQKDFPMTEKYLPPSIPSSFTGKHKVRRSRFEPQLTLEEATPKRHEIDAATRAMILGEGTSSTRTPAREVPSQSAKPPAESAKEKEAKREVETPKRVSLFDVKPGGLIFDKFVSAGKSEEHAELLEPVQPSETTHGTKDQRDAAKKKMFGPLTRVVVSWLPNALLCKRFNVPEPVFSDADVKTKQKRQRNLIFESASVSDHTSDARKVHEAGLRPRSEIPPAASSTNRPDSPAIAAISAPHTLSNSATAHAASILITGATSTPSACSAGVSGPTKGTDNEQKPAPDPTERLDISKHVNLFKAVFMDSDSEAEDNGDNDNAVDKRDSLQADKSRHHDADEERRVRDEEMKAKVLGADLLLPQIKPIKLGILSNVESVLADRVGPGAAATAATALTEPPKQANRKEATAAEIIDEGMTNFISSDNMYGPRLPEKITFRKPEKSTHLAKLSSGSESDSDWVEKSEKKHKHKKEKQHKKDKHKKRHKKGKRK